MPGHAWQSQREVTEPDSFARLSRHTAGAAEALCCQSFSAGGKWPPKLESLAFSRRVRQPPAVKPPPMPAKV